MLKTVNALPSFWFESGWLRKIRLATSLFGVLFFGISLLCIIFLAVDFQATQLQVTLSLGDNVTEHPRALAKLVVVLLAVISFMLAMVCFVVDFLSRSIQRRNDFLLNIKNDIRNFSRSYEPQPKNIESTTF